MFMLVYMLLVEACGAYECAWRSLYVHVFTRCVLLRQELRSCGCVRVPSLITAFIGDARAPQLSDDVLLAARSLVWAISRSLLFVW